MHRRFRGALYGLPLLFATGCCGLVTLRLDTHPVVNLQEDPVYPEFPKQSYEPFMCDNGLLSAASQAYRDAPIEYNC